MKLCISDAKQEAVTVVQTRAMSQFTQCALAANCTEIKKMNVETKEGMRTKKVMSVITFE